MIQSAGHIYSSFYNPFLTGSHTQRSIFMAAHICFLLLSWLQFFPHCTLYPLGVLSHRSKALLTCYDVIFHVMQRLSDILGDLLAPRGSHLAHASSRRQPNIGTCAPPHLTAALFSLPFSKGVQEIEKIKCQVLSIFLFSIPCNGKAALHIFVYSPQLRPQLKELSVAVWATDVRAPGTGLNLQQICWNMLAWCQSVPDKCCYISISVDLLMSSRI